MRDLDQLRAVVTVRADDLEAAAAPNTPQGRAVAALLDVIHAITITDPDPAPSTPARRAA